MEAREYRVPDLPVKAIRAFRTMAEAGLTGASRIKVPWQLVVRRRIQAILTFDPKIQEINCGVEKEKV